MILAFASKKGGVAKTTSAVSIAAALARKQQRVLLIDLDPQASASLSLGIPRSKLAPSGADVLFDNLPLDRAIRATDHPQLDLLTSSTDLASLEERLAAFRSREQVLRRKLAPWDEVYDYILIDCPSGFSLLTRCALVASQGYIVPLVPHFLAQEGVANLIAGVERLSLKNGDSKSGPGTRLLGVLLTMVDYRTRLARTLVEEIRAAYGSKVFAIEVRTNVRLAEAPAEGSSIFEYDPNCAGALAYDLVADEILLRTRSQPELSPDVSPRDASRSKTTRRDVQPTTVLPATVPPKKVPPKKVPLEMPAGVARSETPRPAHAPRASVDGQTPRDDPRRRHPVHGSRVDSPASAYSR